jgi:hypothetical protein
MAKDQGYVTGLKGQATKEQLSMALKVMERAFPGSDLVDTDTMSGQDHVAIHFAVDTDRSDDESDSAEGRIAEYWLQPSFPELSPTPSLRHGGADS